MVGKRESRPTSIKGILILGASIVCDLNASSTLIGILIEIKIGSFVEPMMARLLCLWSVVIVNIGEAIVA